MFVVNEFEPVFKFLIRVLICKCLNVLGIELKVNSVDVPSPFIVAMDSNDGAAAAAKLR
jgi:hypothetical protein